MVAPSRVHAPLEKRCVLVIPASEAGNADLCHGIRARVTEGIAYLRRAKVVEAVSRGEMRWVDALHNVATDVTDDADTVLAAIRSPAAFNSSSFSMLKRSLPGRESMIFLLPRVIFLWFSAPIRA
jgi:hypothetical protein